MDAFKKLPDERAELVEEREVLNSDWQRLEEEWAKLAGERENLVEVIKREALALAGHMLEKGGWVEKAAEPVIHLDVHLPPDLVNVRVPAVPVAVTVQQANQTTEIETFVKRDEMGRILETTKVSRPQGAKPVSANFDGLVRGGAGPVGD